mmetsp:Transcript_6702/g.13310  ORF Transcript_6702/g.13310 Transcript_6702/m.13310 type:complete len:280 (-) Transcript_6702:89-928(-)
MGKDLTPEQDRSQKDEDESDADEREEIMVHQHEMKNKSEIPPVSVHETSNTETEESQPPKVNGTPDWDAENRPEQEMEDEMGGLKNEDLSSQREGKEHGDCARERARAGELTSPSGMSEHDLTHGQPTDGNSPVAFDDSPLMNSDENPLSPSQFTKDAAHVWPSFVSVPQSNCENVGSEQDSPENVSVLGDGGASTIRQERHWERESQILGERNPSVTGSIASRISYRVMYPPMPVCCLQNIGSLEVYHSSSKKRKKKGPGGKMKRAKRDMHVRSQLVM